MVSGSVCPALKGPQALVRQLRTAGKARFVKFRAQVMMVEYEPGPLQRTEGHGEGPEDIGRVAGLNHRKTA